MNSIFNLPLFFHDLPCFEGLPILQMNQILLRQQSSIRRIYQTAVDTMDLEWHNMTPLYTTGKAVYPNHRWGHSGCTVRDPYIFLFGGYSDSKYFNDTWIFNWTTGEWVNLNTDASSSCPSARSNCTVVYDEKRDRVVLFGGGSASNVRHNDIWVMELKQFYQNQKEQAEQQRKKGTKTDPKNLHKYKPQWTQQFKADQHHISEVLWPRTYHAGILIDNHLFIHGGEGYGSDLDDLWTYNLETKKWKEIKTTNTPKGRRFHTGVRVDNYLYIVGGCFDGYNCLNDIHRISLDRFIRKQRQIALLDQNFSTLAMDQQNYLNPWQCVNVIDKSIFVPRWGHMACSIGNNIYIFGGRSYSDHNDVLLLETTTSTSKSGSNNNPDNLKSMSSNPQLKHQNSYSSQQPKPFDENANSNSDVLSSVTEPMRMSKLRNLQTPKGRRRACMWVIGSCIVLHGGFNGNYFEDMNFLNVHQTIPLEFDQLELYDEKSKQSASTEYPYDIHIYTSDQKILHLRTKDIRNSFTSEEKMVQFIEALAQFNYDDASEYATILKTGVFDEGRNQASKKINKQVLSKYCIIYGGCILSACQRRLLCTVVQEQILMTHNNPLRALKVTRGQIERIFTVIQNDRFNDIALHCNSLLQDKPKSSKHNFVFQPAKPFKANLHSLARRSLYFSMMIQASPFFKKEPINLSGLESNEKEGSPSAEQTSFCYKLLLIYLHHGHMVIPHCFTLEQMLSTYQLAEMYLIQGARRILLQQIMNRISNSFENSVEEFKNEAWASMGWDEEQKKSVQQKSKYSSDYMEKVVQFCLKSADWENLSKILQMTVGKIILEAAKNTANQLSSSKKLIQRKEQSKQSGIFSFMNLSSVLCMGKKSAEKSSQPNKKSAVTDSMRKLGKTPNSLKNLNFRRQTSTEGKNKQNLPPPTLRHSMSLDTQKQLNQYFNPYEMQRKVPSEADFEFELELENVMEGLDQLQNRYDKSFYRKKKNCANTDRYSSLGEIVHSVKDLYKLEIAFWRASK